ncbi:transglutaminase family protein [Oharaeibacter diazotrophicus]|uniref:Transglutaminase-like putative cysteine protease n=1 Tax=Oharaeibacter diazotrophicus TaxID=1920512 RepID=A0A4R6RLN7_9HYPH|nr:transglutaminase family protein [Oharaeibacter diazotrophicus]TDP87573.1 transglutaminase-like putative cysteine protease [Oharaeibacter diazotrophicus]BBE70483.1 transglutaminase-like superfamily protein [Pleomorphomonas sp. SM30]GLS77228.1 transglutaminase [Oharaeibacter diazotrophicus]
MRLRVSHEINAVFTPPSSLSVREIRMTPRTYDGQYVGEWRIDVGHDCWLDRVADALGNTVHDFTVTGPAGSLSIVAAGEVEVDDTNGVLQAGHERLPPALFLRETRLTAAGEAVRALAGESAAAGTGPLDRCHALMAILAERFEIGTAEEAEVTGTVDRTAEETALAVAGSPTGLAHVFVAAARVLQIPSRFVTGYLWRGDARDDGEAAHAWAEAHVPGLGWVGFDVAENRCPTDAYVRVAAGFDQNGAAWVRGADRGVDRMATTSRAVIRRRDG